MKNFLCLFLVSAMLLGGCAENAASSGNPESFDLEALLNAVSEAGFDYEYSEIIWNEDVLTGKADAIIVRNGGQEEYFTVYSYDSNKKAQADTKIVNESGHGFNYPDGRMVETSWVSYPHFFKQGRIIAFYCGDEAWILELLSNTLGEPFAGTGRTYIPPPAETLDSLLHVLSHAGLEHEIIENDPNTVNPFDFYFPEAIMRGVTIRKGAEEDFITIFSYNTTEELEANAFEINPHDPFPLLDMIAPPVLFKNGEIIVLYVGYEKWVYAFLADTFGEPFAGYTRHIQ
jgi:hypothetical protein